MYSTLDFSNKTIPMMRGHIFLLNILMVFSLSILGVTAQKNQLKRANREYSNLAYLDASKIYEKVAEKGFRSVELLKKLGNTYYFNSQYPQAFKWYEELFKMTADIEPIYYLRYAQTLKSVNDERAKTFYNTYLDMVGGNEGFLSMEDYMAIIKRNSDRYEIENMRLNSRLSDFGGILLDNQLVFSSTRDTGNLVKRRSRWDGDPYLDLYGVTLRRDGSTGKPEKIKGDVNSIFHESSPTFTKDGKTMYFTRNGEAIKGANKKTKTHNVKIYRATLEGGEWINVEELSINSDSYSTAHPALGPNDDQLYFVSDRPESLGLSDIFVVDINADGSLGKVINLGSKVNTKGRESFPFVTKDNELYFSSDGHFGLGGFDVFYAGLGELDFGDLINVGVPVNSNFDDFAFAIYQGKGYFSSNREGGNGKDDIYSFVETKDIKELLKSRIYGVVLDEDTRDPLPNTMISIEDDDRRSIASVTTDSTGFYEVDVDYYKSFFVRATEEDYDTAEQYALKKKKEREHNFDLSRNFYGVKQGDDLAEFLNIKIYFDFDKSNIRYDASVELEKLIAFLKDSPNIELDVRSHTDSRGSKAYNDKLSQERARSTVAYMVKNGIAPERLSYKGYGETQSLNDCRDGARCREQEHQENRRSEFIVK